MNARLLAITLLLAGAGLASCEKSAPRSERIPPIGTAFRPEFQKGVCFSHNHALNRGYGSEMAEESLRLVRELGANAVSISPVGYMFNLHDPRVFGYRGEDLTMTPERVRKTIRDAHAAGLQVFLNPHIWVGLYGSPGEWRGDVEMKSDEDWRKWFKSYREFILFFARMAEEEGVELFSVGSEMRRATEMRPYEWRLLIREVRGVYHGPCTYAANWSEEFDRIPFWDLLEYVGISAYFPVGSGTLEERIAAASEVRDGLARFSRAWNKPIFFAELGFRSAARAGEAPSEWKTGAAVDLEEQRLCYEAMLPVMWNEPWFSGVYCWQWFSDLTFSPDPATDFQFRGKPAEAVIRQFFTQPRTRP